jgi:glycosyltransferase involved in cell wall biosynthesis
MDQMKIAHFTTYPNQGGAGIAAWRLVRGLRSRGVDADLVGIWKFGITDEPGQQNFAYDRKLAHRLWRVARRFQVDWFNKKLPSASLRGGMPFHSDLSPLGQPMLESAMGADIVHLHWVCDFIDYEYFFSKLPVGVPIFWTLHDMNPFTGGCIHSYGCQKFQIACGKCPLLGSESPNDESARVLQRKVQALAPHLRNLCVVTPSQWLGDLAQKSRVFVGAQFRVVPNGVDLNIYHPQGRKRGRAMISATDQEQVILFVAASLRQTLKGGPLLIEAWKELEARGVKTRVVCLGDSTGFEAPENWQLLSFAEEEKEKAAILAAADVLAVPSEVENYPNVICEVLACGVPVVGSCVGGIPELVLDGLTGFTFKERNAVCLADSLQRLLESLPSERGGWSDRCRAFAERTFCMTDIEKRHIQLYEEAGVNVEAVLA